jgi:hypothetical protein
MTAGWRDPDDEEDEEYFPEISDDELTGNEPRFIRIESLNMPNDEMAKLKVDELIETYIAARNQLATDRKGYKARELAVKTHLSVISMLLRDQGDTIGVESFRTDKGTAYRNVKEKFTVETWDSLVQYLKDTGNFHVLQKRVSPNAIKEIRATDGALPPGIGSLVEVEFAVRSPTSRKAK